MLEKNSGSGCPEPFKLRLAQWTLYGVFFISAKVRQIMGRAHWTEFGMVSAIRFSRKLWVVVILRDLELQ
jgi:hypothetical protein